jgi:thiol:disulfide interchange protein DsbA
MVHEQVSSHPPAGASPLTRFTRRKILAAGTALAITARSTLGAEKWQEGKHYFRINPPQPPPPAATITVTEVFSYGCPACNRFLPFMQGLEKKLAANVVVDYLHASWFPSENWPTFQRAHVTAKALGIARKSSDAFYAAVWKTGELAVLDYRTGRPLSSLPSLQNIAKFYERVAAMPAARFLETAKSFSVDTEIRRTEAMIKALQADGTPTLVINGKYRVEPRYAGGDPQAVDLTLLLAR